ncbi:MAG TPA: hypothetical protein PLV83_01440 [Bacilli bacterium]|nr:hypothetical protein [Bacilli bacterium]
MSVATIPMKSKIIFSRMLANMMKKEIISKDELTKQVDINQAKQHLREYYTELQEKFSTGLITEEEYRKETSMYNYKLIKLNFDCYETESKIKEKELYYKRLEILCDILNGEQESIDSLDSLYSNLLENIKDEAIERLRAKLNMTRLILQMNVYSKEIDKEQEFEYRDALYNTQTEMEEIKKFLKVDKLDKVKEFPFEKLVNSDGYNLLCTFYEEELYNSNSKAK